VLDGVEVQRQFLVTGRPIFGFPNVGNLSSGWVSIKCSRYIGIVPFCVSTSCNLVGDHHPTILYDIRTQRQQSKFLMPQNIQILKKFPATWICTHYTLTHTTGLLPKMCQNWPFWWSNCRSQAEIL